MKVCVSILLSMLQICMNSVNIYIAWSMLKTCEFTVWLDLGLDSYLQELIWKLGLKLRKLIAFNNNTGIRN